MVERLYPGVYVSEVAFSAKPIEGVSTTHPSTAANAAREAAPFATPEWTQHNQSDPGITLVQLSAWLGDSLLYREHPQAAHEAGHAPAQWGVAQGLAVEAGDGATAGVSVTPGSASSADGRPITADSPTAAHRIHKP